MLEVVRPLALLGSLIFAAAFLYFPTRLYMSGEGFSDFSVGVGYEDLFLIILSFVPLAAATNYLFTAFGLGVVEVGARTLSYIRYFEWMMSTPFILIGIVILTQNNQLLSKIVLVDIAMLGFGFAASMMTTQLRWVFFALSGIGWIGLVYLLTKTATEAIHERPESLHWVFYRLKWITVGVWSIYPFFWIVSQDGLGIVGFQTTLIGFLVLDLVAKIGYVFYVARGMNRIATIETGIE